MSDYVTDPALLAELNGEGGYVNDPELLKQLNAPEVGKTLGELSFGEVGQAAGQVAGGVAGMAGDAITGAWGAIPGKQYIIPGATAFGLAEGFKNLPRAAEAVKNFVGAGGAVPPPAPVAPAVPAAPAGGAMYGQGPVAAPQAAAGTSMMTNLTPAMMLGAPYAMAGMEAANIRKNPNAPGYANVPYAQMYRGEAPTMGSAAAANRRESIRGQQYGGLTAEEQNMLKMDRELSLAMRVKAAKKVLGQP